MDNWTKPYHGVTHCGPTDSILKAPWCTVTDHKTCAVLQCHTPDERTAFKTLRTVASVHDTVELAKQAGEEWLRK